MSIKVIEQKDMSKHGGGKQDLLAADIQEIIVNRIEYCEFENFPYAEKTSIADIMRHMLPVFANEFKKESGSYPKGYTRQSWNSEWKPPFVMRRVKLNDGVHVYGTFYVKTWEKEIEEAKGSIVI